MKARKVKGLEPDGTLGENAKAIVEVRVDELRSFADEAREPANQMALHDMRIAAKRVRYLLELTAPALGPAARRGAKQAKELQTLLGEVHDCDELLASVVEHVERLRAQDAAALRQLGAEGAEDLDASVARAAPNRTRYRGLEALHAYLRARRDVLHARFLREWGALERRSFWSGLVSELGTRAASDDPPPER